MEQKAAAVTACSRYTNRPFGSTSHGAQTVICIATRTLDDVESNDNREAQFDKKKGIHIVTRK